MFVPYIGRDRLGYIESMLLKKLPKSLQNRIHRLCADMKRLVKDGDEEGAGLVAASMMRYCRENIDNAKHRIIAFLLIIIKRHEFGLEFPDCAFNEILQLVNHHIEDKEARERFYHYLAFVASATEQHDWSDMITIKYLRNHAVTSVSSSDSFSDFRPRR